MTPTIERLTKMRRELVKVREATLAGLATNFSEGTAAGIQIALVLLDRVIYAEVKAEQEES